MLAKEQVPLVMRYINSACDDAMASCTHVLMAIDGTLGLAGNL